MPARTAASVSPGSQTWLPVNPNHAAGVNVAAEADDPASLLSFYRRLIHLRQTTPALIGGSYQDVDPGNEACFVMLRQAANADQTCLVALNFTDQEQQLMVDFADKKLRCLFSTQERSGETDVLEPLQLAPFEVFIAELI